MKRLPASRLTRKALDELFEQGANVKGDLVRLEIKQIIEEKLKAKSKRTAKLGLL